MADGKQTLTIVLTVDEITAILNMVAEFPYNKSAPIISKIQAQAAPQLRPVEDTVSDKE